MNNIQLIVLTPYGKYFEGFVDFLEVRSPEYNLGILPGHTPLISTVAICKMTVKIGDRKEYYAVGGGVIRVEKDNKVTLILDSIESADEIDIARAQEAKKRAEDRLSEAIKNDAIDVSRAKLALLKAINRINIGTNK